MTWFVNWWDGLTLLQQVFAVVAIPSTLILVIQTVMLLFGLGGSHGELDNGESDFSGIDTDGDGVPDSFDIDGDGVPDVGGIDLDGDGIPDVPHDVGHFEAGDRHDVNTAGHDGSHSGSGLRLFTLRGIVALFAVGGWLGVMLVDLGASPAVTVISAFAGGFLALLFCALIIKWSLSLQENGTFSVKTAIARTGNVYIPIPPERQGSGKITLNLEDRFLELEAMTDEKEKIPTGKSVQVVSVTDKNVLIVRSVL